MKEIRHSLKSLLSWSDRLGSDEIDEINRLIDYIDEINRLIDYIDEKHKVI